MNSLQFKHFRTLFIICLAAVCFSGCKKEEKTEDKPQNQNPVVEADYILFKGYKMKLNNPKTYEIDIDAGDTILFWGGSTGNPGDTSIFIRHPEGIKAGSNTVVDYAFNYGEVGLFLNWGIPGVNPEVRLTGGDYKIERVNNRWVSTLKNGTGVWKRSSGDINYTGIEVKITWPQF